MRIQHNILAMNAYRNYNTNTSALAKNLEKLSSGYKINRAGDDAAGLAISEKMRAQITGLNAAQKNVKDGISLVKTAEGAMQEIQDMLNRMDYLATQSANGTYDDPVDRKNLQKEVEALKTEIDRIADSANFNGIKLLDGSLDPDNTTGRLKELAAEKLTQMTIPGTDTNPPNVDMDADKTVLKKEGMEAKKTEFSLDLRTLAANAADGDKMEITVGNDKITINFDDTAVEDGEFDAGTGDFKMKGGNITTEKLAAAIAKAFNGDDPTNTPGTIDGQDFKATADGKTVKFEQINEPTGADDTVSGALTVKVDYTKAGETNPTPFAAGDPSKVEGTASSTIGVDGSDAVKAVYKSTISETQALVEGNTIQIGGDTYTVVADTATPGANDVKVSDVNSADKFAAFLAGKMTNADYDVTANGADIVFTAKNAGLIGTSGPSATPTAPTFTLAQGTGANTPALTAAAATVDTAGVEAVTATKTLDGTNLNTAAIKAAADAVAGIGDGSIQIQKNAANNLELVIGGHVIGTSDEVVNSTATSFTFKDANGDSLGTVTTTAGLAAADITRASMDTGLTYTAATAPAPGPGGDPDASVTGPKGQYESKTVLIQEGTAEKADQLASTTLTLDANIVKDGGVLKIGDSKFVFKVGADSTVTAGEGETLIDLSAYEANDAGLIDAAGAALSNETASDAFDLGYNGGGKLGVYEQEDQTKYGQDVLGNLAEFNKLFSSGTAAKTERLEAGNPLTLQIGDTSDSFNQMGVKVGDMHVDAMGKGILNEGTADAKNIEKSVAEVDISNQEGAHEAIDIIKNAINYVSGVRGDLGAVQNRLEHTANNLSVMAENIQDAESTIRDTDIAEEMMSYTKNNILIQSAQAMLAQANAVPQGVLQLLG